MAKCDARARDFGRFHQPGNSLINLLGRNSGPINALNRPVFSRGERRTETQHNKTPKQFFCLQLQSRHRHAPYIQVYLLYTFRRDVRMRKFLESRDISLAGWV